MLLRSLGAMKGFRGIDWAAYGWAVVAWPVNPWTAGSRGSEGMGTAGAEAAHEATGAATRSGTTAPSSPRRSILECMTRQRATVREGTGPWVRLRRHTRWSP